MTRSRNRTRALRTALLLPVALGALAGPSAALAGTLAEGGFQGGSSDPTIRLMEKPVRTLQPLADEYVPAFTCPVTHPYLVDERFDGNPTSALRGILVRRSSKDLDVSITGPAGVAHPFLPGRLLLSGIRPGFPNSSAMNWSFESQQYQIIMKCTSNPALGKDVTNLAAIIA
jgi:hypothetical protein